MLLGELFQLGLVAEQLVQRGLGVLGGQLVGDARVGRQLPVDAEERDGADLQVQIGALASRRARAGPS